MAKPLFECLLASDLHLEQSSARWPRSQKSPLILLLGDIMQASLLSEEAYYYRFQEFFDNVSAAGDTVLYVLGNHEYYGSAVEDVVPKLRDFLKQWPNIILLDNEYYDYNGVRFIGSTLWADANDSNPRTIETLSRIREFEVIRTKAKMVPTTVVTYRKDAKGAYLKDEKGYAIEESRTVVSQPSAFGVQGMIQRHKAARSYIESAVAAAKAENMPFVVLTHHAPSSQSVRPPYNDYKYLHLNGMFVSELTDKIKAWKPVAWLHGHLHNKIAYRVESTLVMVSTRGYDTEMFHYNWTPALLKFEDVNGTVTVEAFEAGKLIKT